MKIKIFNSNDYPSIKEIEDAVNRFIVDIEVVDIKMSEFGYGGTEYEGGGYSLTCLVLYKENN